YVYGQRLDHISGKTHLDRYLNLGSHDDHHGINDADVPDQLPALPNISLPNRNRQFTDTFHSVLHDDSAGRVVSQPDLIDNSDIVNISDFNEIDRFLTSQRHQWLLNHDHSNDDAPGPHNTQPDDYHFINQQSVHDIYPLGPGPDVIPQIYFGTINV